MLALGKRYLLRHKILVILYIATYLLGHSVLPAAVGLYAQKISNNIPVAQQEALSETANARESTRGNAAPKATVGGRLPARISDHSELLLAYGLWLTATLAVAIMSLVFSYISTVLGGRVSNAIRQDLFAAVLRKPSLFFHEIPPQQLTVLVNTLLLQLQSAFQADLLGPPLHSSRVHLPAY